MLERVFKSWSDAGFSLAFGLALAAGCSPTNGPGAGSAGAGDDAASGGATPTGSGAVSLGGAPGGTGGSPPAPSTGSPLSDAGFTSGGSGAGAAAAISSAGTGAASDGGSDPGTLFEPRLRPSSDGRYLEWSDGTAVFLLSDTAWLLPARYSLAEVEAHVATRVAQGFTAIQMTASFPENDNQLLDTVFIDGDFTAPVTSYWSSLDEKIQVITAADLVAIVNPFWKKTGDAVLESNGPASCRAYGKWLGTRYRDNPRVAYFVGGDDTPAEVREELDAMGLGIQDAYAEAGLPEAIVAYHGDPNRTSREEWPDNPSWLTLNWSYAYSEPLGAPVPYQDNRADSAKLPAMPIMFGEGWYDRDNGATQSSRWANRFMLRRQVWWNPLSGALAGYAYGAEPIWLHEYQGITAAEAALWNSGQDASRMKAFLDTLDWWRLRPDLEDTFLTAGNDALAAEDFAVGALADDNSFGLVYVPTARNVTLRMPVGRDYTLRWFDPTNATYRTESLAAASGSSVVLVHPGNNASGAADWVMHVQGVD